MPDQPEPFHHETLIDALVAFQADLPRITKDNTAHVPTKSGGSYSYTYADLASITHQVMPLLTRHGLGFTSGPDYREGAGTVLAWALVHVSGETREGVYPLPPPGSRTPQEMGGQITYARRYAMVAALGLAPDDDDDGAAAQQGAYRERAEQQQRRDGLRGRADAAAVAPPAPGRTGGRTAQESPITDAQMKALHAGFSGIGLVDRDDKLNYANGVLEAHAIGRTITSSTELTRREAGLVIDQLQRDAEPPAPKGESTDG